MPDNDDDDIDERERCKNCKFYFPSDNQSGDCRRYPPASTSYEFPNCTKNQWCGEWLKK
jgi:hypothetical protein